LGVGVPEQADLAALGVDLADQVGAEIEEEQIVLRVGLDAVDAVFLRSRQVPVGDEGLERHRGQIDPVDAGNPDRVHPDLAIDLRGGGITMACWEVLLLMSLGNGIIVNCSS